MAPTFAYMNVTGSLGLAATLSALATLVYFLGLVVYRLWFHSLARFPGPVINAFCPVPPIISLLRGRWAMDTKKLHDRYGPVVRVSPNELAFNGADAWEDIYGYRHGQANMPKDPVHAGAVQVVKGVSSMQYEPDDAVHARQRRGLAHSFSAKALLEQESIVETYMAKLVDNIKRLSNQGTQFDICDWLNFTTFDIIGDLAFKEYYQCLDKGDFHYWVNLVFKAVKAGALVQATRRFAAAGSLTQRLLLKCFGDIAAPNRRHMQLSREQVLKRLESSDDEHRDFIRYIMQQKDKFQLRQDDVIANSALFILAGSETTSSALAGLIPRLLRNPQAYAKLVQEICTEFQEEREITHDRVMKMTYVNACLMEGLRIHPPIPPGLLRTVPAGGATIDGYWVPPGTTVSVGSWGASHNPANFHNPDDFIPEQWINEEYASDKNKATQPFSLGPRGCLGKKQVLTVLRSASPALGTLAWLEIRLTLTRLLWNFDFTSASAAGLDKWEPEGEMKHMRAFMVWDRPQLNIKATVVRE